MTDTVVVTDLDGTLWGADIRCHERTLAALAELSDAAVPVLVATGRRATSARVGLDANGISLPTVLLNGALGIDFATDVTFHQHAYEPLAATAIVDILALHGLSPCVYTNDGLVQTTHSPTTSPRHIDSVGSDIRRHESLQRVCDGHTVLGMSMLGLTHSQLLPVHAALTASGHGEVAFYQDHLYEDWSLMVQPPGISKWQGIEAWLRHENLQPDRVIAIGDGGNDLEMLRRADVAVAIRGGDPDALAMADHIIDPPDQGGWAQILALL